MSNSKVLLYALLIAAATFSFKFSTNIYDFSLYGVERVSRVDEMADQKKIGELASGCNSRIKVGGSTFNFEGQRNNSILVRVRDDPKGFEPWGAKVLKVNSKLNYVVLKLPEENVARSLERISSHPNVVWVDSHCESEIVEYVSQESETCRDRPTEFSVNSLRQNIRVHTLPKPANLCNCSGSSSCICKLRDVIGIHGVDQLITASPPPLIAVLDNGFHVSSNSELVNYFGKAKLNTILTSSWNYCTQSPIVAKRNHGTEMVNLIAGSCPEGNNEPCTLGINQRSRVFLAQVFKGEKELIDYASVADAISDSVELGAKVISASFIICKQGITHENYVPSECHDDETGLKIIKEALQQASMSAVFVTGARDPDTSALSPVYPANFDLQNVLAVQNATWSERRRKMETIVLGWPLRLDLGVPGNLQEVSNPGLSNAIAIMSGSVALLLSYEECRNLEPRKIIEIFRKESSYEYWVEESRKESNRSQGYLDLHFLHNGDYVRELCS